MADKNQEWQGTVKVVDPQALALAPVLPSAIVPSATVDASRVMSETQAMVMLARSAPRNYLDIKRSIKDVCGRLRFAEKATFRFPRGGSHVSGPSIRLMEALVGAMGNIDAGWRILDFEDERARVETYAWDMQSNTRKRIEFWVKYIRDTSNGPVLLTSERDRYEAVASVAQRRVRACIQNIIPFDIVDEALEMCTETIKKGDGSKPLKDRVAAMVLAFEELGVSQVMLEGNLGHGVDAIIVDELPKMREIYNALAEGHARREEFFDLSLAGQAPAPKSTAAPAPAAKPADPAPVETPNPADPPPVAETAKAAEPPKPAPAVHVVTKPETSEPASTATPRLFDTLMGRLHTTYKMTDEQIRAALGGPIEGAPVEELERCIAEIELANKRSRKKGQPADGPTLNLVPQGEPEPSGPPEMEMPPNDQDEEF
ncbi:MAG: hypothetical protein PHX83_06760 [Acidobacteriia bacterium]|nr:hypothetical protein [Terriglobia bacterium]